MEYVSSSTPAGILVRQFQTGILWVVIMQQFWSPYAMFFKTKKTDNNKVCSKKYFFNERKGRDVLLPYFQNARDYLPKLTDVDTHLV